MTYYCDRAWPATILSPDRSRRRYNRDNDSGYRCARDDERDELVMTPEHLFRLFEKQEAGSRI